MEVLSANHLETEKHRESEGCDIWVPFFWLLFFGTKKSDWLPGHPRQCHMEENTHN
jgi:hypothetical protein